MDKIISARHFHLDDGTKAYIVEQLEHLEAKHQRLVSARVVLELQRSRFFAEVVIHGRRLQIGAKAQANELKPAVEMAIDRAQAQLMKFVDRVHDHAHTPVHQLELERENLIENAG